MRGQLLGDLGGYAIDDLGMKSLAKTAQYFRRSDNHKAIETIGVGTAIKCFRDLAGEPFLFKVMPVDFLHGASGCTRACRRSSGPIGALVPRSRIVLLKKPLDDEVNASLIASVA
jgi:hypothetical protein